MEKWYFPNQRSEQGPSNNDDDEQPRSNEKIMDDPENNESMAESQRSQSSLSNVDSISNMFTEKSFFYFTRQNPIRRAAVRLITWR